MTLRFGTETDPAEWHELASRRASARPGCRFGRTGSTARTWLVFAQSWAEWCGLDEVANLMGAGATL
jgi:hypothetical protein